MARAKIMGVLNVTPDSFYDRRATFDEAVAHGLKMAGEGADILDIGGESSRPGAEPVPVEEELRRVIPVVKALQGTLPISVDTTKVEVAEAALQAGASIINDISGLQSKEMRSLVRDSGATACVMHMQGTPETMQTNPSYPRGVVPELVDWFSRRLELILEDGVKRDQLILDPGIGFGKRVADNVALLQNVPQFRQFELPILIGASRKSFLRKICGEKSADLLSATLAVHTMALVGGAAILRVHDVASHRQISDLNDYFQTL